MRKWKCKVCGYTHKGEAPPEECPICKADRSQFIEIDANDKEIAATPSREVGPIPAGRETSAVSALRPSRFDSLLVKMVLRHHLHPIMVHFPNGLLPASVVFLVVGSFLSLESFREAAFLNMVFVLATMPFVIVTGYFDWQQRYQGAKTFLFLLKISCSIVVFLCLPFLVIWRFIDPTVADPASANRLLYLGISLFVLAGVAIAGHIGGKLVFSGRGH